MLLRLTYLGVTNAFALLRLLPMSDRDKDTEILTLRHRIMVLEHQLGNARPRFSPGDHPWHHTGHCGHRGLNPGHRGHEQDQGEPTLHGDTSG